MKSISTINPAIMGNMDCLIINACTAAIDRCVTISNGVSLQSHKEAIMCVPKIITYMLVEKAKESKGKLWKKHNASIGDILADYNFCPLFFVHTGTVLSLQVSLNHLSKQNLTDTPSVK